jgi:hypothetical protein
MKRGIFRFQNNELITQFMSNKNIYLISGLGICRLPTSRKSGKAIFLSLPSFSTLKNLSLRRKKAFCPSMDMDAF